jgi:uncharacterized protein (DUF983 family)
MRILAAYRTLLRGTVLAAVTAISDQRARPAFFATLARGLRLRCPCCGLGRLFRGFFRMYHDCPVCGLDYFRESGYYVGAMIINYATTAFLMLVIYLLVVFLVPPLWNAPPETKIPVWMGASILVSLALFHHCRAIWIAVDYWLEPWQPNDPILRTPSQNQ